MNVLLCGPYVYRNQNIWGGVEAVLKNLKSGFAPYESEILLKVVTGASKAQKKYEIYKDITYIKQPRLKVGSVFISQYPFRIKQFLKGSDFDVINSHSIDFAYYGLKMKEKLLFTLHGITWEEKKYIPKYKQPLWHFFYVKKLDKILKKLKYFISINPYATEMVENKTNAIIFDICNPIPNEVFGIRNQRQEKRMFYIGVISKRKNLLTLIKSLNLVRREIKDFKLIVAGKIADKDYFDEIMNYINKNDLNNNVEYLGKITEEQKYEEFSKMSFLVLSSLQETAPMVIPEAFAAGKPVMAPNICGIPYMIDNDKSGFLINPRNERDISNKMIYLLENPDKTKSMSMYCKKYAEKYHSLKTVVEKYKDAYEEIVAKC